MKKIGLVSVLILVVFLLSGLAFYQMNNVVKDVEPTPEENIQTAIKSTQLSSYGWRNEEDAIAANLNLRVYIISQLKKMNNEEKRNYGPVPEGYDQEYFWETGKMKIEEKEK